MARFSQRRGRLGALALAMFCGSLCFVPAPGRERSLRSLRSEAEAGEATEPSGAQGWILQHPSTGMIWYKQYKSIWF